MWALWMYVEAWTQLGSGTRSGKPEMIATTLSLQCHSFNLAERGNRDLLTSLLHVLKTKEELFILEQCHFVYVIYTRVIQMSTRPQCLFTYFHHFYQVNMGLLTEDVTGSNSATRPAVQDWVTLKRLITAHSRLLSGISNETLLLCGPVRQG